MLILTGKIQSLMTDYFGIKSNIYKRSLLLPLLHKVSLIYRYVCINCNKIGATTLRPSGLEPRSFSY